MLKFRCKNCDQKIGVPDDWRGHVVRCPRCKQGVDVPHNAEFVNKAPPPARASTTKPQVAPAPQSVAEIPKVEAPPAPKLDPVPLAAPAPVAAVGTEVPTPAARVAETPAPIPVAAPTPIPISVEAPIVERSQTPPAPEPIVETSAPTPTPSVETIDVALPPSNVAAAKLETILVSEPTSEAVAAAPPRVVEVAPPESVPVFEPNPEPQSAQAPPELIPVLEPHVETIAIAPAAPPPSVELPISPVVPTVVIAPPEPEQFKPVALELTPDATSIKPATLEPTPAAEKPKKRWGRKPKAEAKPLEPIAPPVAAKIVEPEPEVLVPSTAPTPIPETGEPPVTLDAPPVDPSVVVVTVARRDEPSPLADPATGNVVNIAEALTQSVVTPKPIVTSAATSHLTSVFSDGPAPESIPAIIDVESTPPSTPVEVKAAEAVSVAPATTIVASEPIVSAATMEELFPLTATQTTNEPFVDSPANRDLSDIVDVLPSEDLAIEGHSAASDLLDTLSRNAETAHASDGPIDVYFDPEDAPPLQRVKPAPNPADLGKAAVAIASLAMLCAAGSLAMCVTPSHAQISVPAGVVGLLLAVLATALAQRRSSIATITGIGAAIASMIGITIGILIGLGKLPGSAAYNRQQVASHMPTVRTGDLEVRVRSASVLHPVLLMSPKKVGPTAQTASQSVLRVEVEVRNVSDHTAAKYTSWATTSAGAEPVLIYYDEGNSLKPLSAAGAVPPGRVREAVTINPKGGTVGDVLLFEAPPTQTREFDLQLPGNNVGSIQPLQLHIPAEMFARQ